MFCIDSALVNGIGKGLDCGSFLSHCAGGLKDSWVIPSFKTVKIPYLVIGDLLQKWFGISAGGTIPNGLRSDS